MVATIDCRASRTAIGGGDDEESAPIDDRFDGLSRGVEAAAVPTAVEAVEAWRGGRRRGAGPSAHTGEKDGWRVAGAVLGRVFDASTVCCCVTAQWKKTACNGRLYGRLSGRKYDICRAKSSSIPPVRSL